MRFACLLLLITFCICDAQSDCTTAGDAWNSDLSICCSGTTKAACQACTASDAWNADLKVCCSGTTKAACQACTASDAWNADLKVCCSGTTKAACQACTASDAWNADLKVCCSGQNKLACFSCIVGNQWNVITEVCCPAGNIACTGCNVIGSKWNTFTEVCCSADDSSTCMTSCPAGSQWNTVTKFCCSNEDAACTGCLATGSKWNSALGVCCAAGDTLTACTGCTAQGSQWNRFVGTCCSSGDTLIACTGCIATGSKWNSALGVCCAAGDTLTACTGCTAQGSQWNKITGVCCAAGETQSVCSECTATGSKWNSNKGICCASGSSQGTCLSCTAEDSEWNKDLQICCAAGATQSSCTSCTASGSKWNSNKGICCAFGASQGTCLQCTAADSKWNKDIEVCCAAGTTQDTCVSCTATESKWNFKVGACCAAGSSQDACMSCIAFGSKWNNDISTCCPSGTTQSACSICKTAWNTSKKTCCIVAEWNSDSSTCCGWLTGAAKATCFGCTGSDTWYDKLNRCCLSSDSICNICGTSDYASGFDYAKKQCKCKSPLKWNKQTSSCECAANKALITKSLGKYDCKDCTMTATSTTTLPVVDKTRCSCITDSLVWSDTVDNCICPDANNQVYYNDQCITCNSDVLADGKSTFGCKCVNTKILKWSKTSCVCSDSDSVLKVVGDSISCISCKKDKTVNGVKKIPNANQCECPNNLVWDPATYVCKCLEDSMEIAKIGTATVCRCKGKSIKPYDGVGCLSCEATPLSIYQCSCPAGKIWNNYLNTCIDIPAGLAIANAKMKFKCASQKVFDIVTKTCIAKCTEKPCLDCSKIPNTTGVSVTYDSKSVNVKVFPQGDKIVKQYASTNYATLKKEMCTCSPGFYWDVNRVACLFGDLS